MAASRTQAGMSQRQLAAALGRRYDRTMIGHVENGRSGILLDGAVRAAQVLGVSLDYLTGLTDDPLPSAQLSALLGPGPRGAADAPGSRPVDTIELAAAAGGGAMVFDETPVGRIWFRRDWLDGLGLDATQCSVIGVIGDSMEPTLPDGCKILVDRASRSRRNGRIFVLRTGEGLVAKRLARTRSRWELRSDNEGHPALPWPDETEIIGEVRWSATTFAR